jgi:single-stranded-DNA-specific exonuclease
VQAVRAFTPEASPAEVVQSLTRGLGVTRTFARILQARGHDDVAATRQFLDPRLADLTPPGAMADREAATDRLVSAIRRRERIVIFGDYDVDGITSAAVMTSALRALGGEVVPVLASRFDGGYGFSQRALERVRAHSPGLVVTCDCGSSDHDRLAQLRAASIDAIVIDHHLVPEQALPAFAFLNPHRAECGFPFKHLASCGLALSIAAALRTRLGVALDLRPLLDLVALGTVADVAPLVGDNRALVRAGLLRIATSPRPGIEALAEISGLGAGVAVSAEDISFKLAPRINAPGRLGSPDVALELLLETDLGRARSLAARLEQDCVARREIERRIVGEATAQIHELGMGHAPGIVVAAQGWHVGVVGIVAARLVDAFHVPVVVIALEGEEGRGSVRGPAGSRLHDALTAAREGLLGFGGHQAAAGVHVAAGAVEKFRELFLQACASAANPDRSGTSDDESDVRSTRVGPLADATLDPLDEPGAVVADLERLEPCGEGNRAPLLRVLDAEVLSVRIMKEEHLRLVVRHGGRLLDGFGYSLADQAPERGARIDLLGRLKRDTYRGRGAVELRVHGVTRRESPVT